MEWMIELAALGVVGAICTLLVRRYNGEIGMALALGVGVLILTQVADGFQEILQFVERMGELAGLSPAVLAPVIKTVAISILTRMTVALCKDAGEGGIATFVELAGVVCATVVTIPLLEAVLDMVVDLL